MAWLGSGGRNNCPAPTFPACLPPSRTAFAKLSACHHLPACLACLLPTLPSHPQHAHTFSCSSLPPSHIHITHIACPCLPCAAFPHPLSLCDLPFPLFSHNTGGSLAFALLFAFLPPSYHRGATHILPLHMLCIFFLTGRAGGRFPLPAVTVISGAGVGPCFCRRRLGGTLCSIGTFICGLGMRPFLSPSTTLSCSAS